MAAETDKKKKREPHARAGALFRLRLIKNNVRTGLNGVFSLRLENYTTADLDALTGDLLRSVGRGNSMRGHSPITPHTQTPTAMGPPHHSHLLQSLIRITTTAARRTPKMARKK